MIEFYFSIFLNPICELRKRIRKTIEELFLHYTLNLD